MTSQNFEVANAEGTLPYICWQASGLLALDWKAFLLHYAREAVKLSILFSVRTTSQRRTGMMSKPPLCSTYVKLAKLWLQGRKELVRSS